MPSNARVDDDWMFYRKDGVMKRFLKRLKRQQNAAISAQMEEEYKEAEDARKHKKGKK